MEMASSMHILFLPSWYPSDPDDVGGSFFREQANALQASGCKVGVIAPALTPLRRPAAALRCAGKIRIELDNGVPTYRASTPNITPRQSNLIFHRVGNLGSRLFDRYVEQEGLPDIIHVHAALSAGAAALKIRARHRVPFVLSEHSSALARGRINSSGLNQMRKVFDGASSAYAVSSTFASLLESRLGLQSGACQVMPNSVNDLFFREAISLARPGGFQFCHISLLDPNKNVDALIRAFASGFRGLQDVSLVIGGDGSTRLALQDLARQLGVDNQVTFPGRLSRSQVRDVIARSDTFVLPSRFETFGVVLIEATAMGVPIIATRCGGPEDIVTENNGLLVPVGDVAALAAVMQRMYKTCEQWDRQRIREECRERFGAAALARKWQEIYSASDFQRAVPA